MTYTARNRYRCFVKIISRNLRSIKSIKESGKEPTK